MLAHCHFKIFMLIYSYFCIYLILFKHIYNLDTNSKYYNKDFLFIPGSTVFNAIILKPCFLKIFMDFLIDLSPRKNLFTLLGSNSSGLSSPFQVSASFFIKSSWVTGLSSSLPSDNCLVKSSLRMSKAVPIEFLLATVSAML